MKAAVFFAGLIVAPGFCGLSAGAGLNGTASTDQTAAGTQATAYCYDQADRLNSTGVMKPGTVQCWELGSRVATCSKLIADIKAAESQPYAFLKGTVIEQAISGSGDGGHFATVTLDRFRIL